MMEYRRLGLSELNVSVLALGAWQIGDPEYWGPVERRDAEATVGAAIDAGVNLFDTAEWYGAGKSEEVLGQALGDKRSKVMIASKVSPQNCTAEGIRQACEASLARLGTDVIDLYQVHWPNHDIPFSETYGALETLLEEGKIRAIGVSNFGTKDLDDWLAIGVCASDQIGYNALFRAPEYEIVPRCLGRNVGILSYMPLMQGLLSGRWSTVEAIPAKRRRTRHFAATREGAMHTEAGAEDVLLETLHALRDVAQEAGHSLASLAIAWLKAQPGVTSVIVGAGRPEQMKQNAQAANLELDPAVLRALTKATEPLKQALGPNADMWKSGAQSRIR